MTQLEYLTLKMDQYSKTYTCYFCGGDWASCNGATVMQQKRPTVKMLTLHMLIRILSLDFNVKYLSYDARQLNERIQPKHF